MRIRTIIFFLLIVITFSAVAISKSEVNDDMRSLVTKIDKINQDINNKQQDQNKLNKIIADSDRAIKQSDGILDKLEYQRDFDEDRLNEIEAIIPKLNDATESAQNNVKLAITKLYSQLRTLDNVSSTSIFSENNTLDNNRKKQYIIILLKNEVVKYKTLQNKLNELNAINQEINAQLLKIDKELGITVKRKQILVSSQKAKVEQSQKINQQIKQEQQKLVSLKTRYAELNKLLNSLSADQNTRGVSNGKTLKVGKVDQSYEDNSPFLYRKLNRPVDGTVIVAFGQLHGDVPNKGILFKASNSNIYSITNGDVLYVGTLPGFGQMIVIDHGDNYVSIYAGLLAKVHKGERVNSGQIIGNSGSPNNQPMGGVYFELRHFGKPVNPSKLSG